MVRAMAVIILTLAGGLAGLLLGQLIMGPGSWAIALAVVGAVLGFWWGMTMKRPIEVIKDLFSDLIGRLL